MDKETISHYGWIVVILVLALVLLMMSSPLSDYIFVNLKTATIESVSERYEQQEVVENASVEYKITYNLNGGVWDGGYISSYVAGRNTKLPSNLSKDNYEFAGWSTTNSNTASTASITTTTTGNITLYAKWVGKQYAISYNLNGGEFTSAPTLLNYRYGTAVTLPTNITKEGYTFAGWYDAALGTAKSITSTTSGNQTLYAKWTKN